MPGKARVVLAAAGLLAAAPAAGAPPAPLWDVSGTWDGWNGAEYLVVRQQRDGRAQLTVHHTCAPGHLEVGAGRITGARLRGRVEPREPPPESCVRFAEIDVRVMPDGRAMVGTFRTDRNPGKLIYFARRRARSLVRFRPSIAPRGRRVRVLVGARPALPAGASAAVTLCGAGRCATRHGRSAASFAPRAGCRAYRATVTFAGARGTARRRLCG